MGAQLDTREQLENISRLKVYKYTYKEEFSEYAGLSDDDRAETGVLAQDVFRVLPDAVRDTGDIVLPSGQRIENFLVVNKVSVPFLSLATCLPALHYHRFYRNCDSRE